MLSPEQIAERQTGIGGSDVGVILGVNKWKSPVALWLEKTGQVQNTVSSEAAEWGNRLESVVADKYAEKNGYRVERLNRSLVHPEHDFARANIDRAVCDAGTIPVHRATGQLRPVAWLLEVKTANEYTKSLWGDVGTDQVPDSYIAQCAWYMAITGARRCDVAVLIGGQQYREFVIHRDEELISAVIESARVFWFDHVLADIPPPPMSKADVELLHPTSTKTTVLASNAQRAAQERLKALKVEAKSLDAERSELETVIADGMSNADTLIDPDGKTIATWKSQDTNRLDTKALKASHPEIAKQFTKTTSGRVLRLK